MTHYESIPHEIEAFLWEPDPWYGDFIDGQYVCRAVGVDCLGAEYTITEVGVQTPGGFYKLSPGDYLIRMPDTYDLYPMPAKAFESRYSFLREDEVPY